MIPDRTHLITQPSSLVCIFHFMFHTAISVASYITNCWSFGTVLRQTPFVQIGDLFRPISPAANQFLVRLVYVNCAVSLKLLTYGLASKSGTYFFPRAHTDASSCERCAYIDSCYCICLIEPASISLEALVQMKKCMKKVRSDPIPDLLSSPSGHYG